MRHPVKLSVVIPVYGSASILPSLVSNLEAALLEAVGEDSFELILVHDCGPDQAWSQITELAETRPWLLGLNLARNVGQHNALMAGLNLAAGEYVITMDDDLQHDPADISRLLAALSPEVDLCYVEFESRWHAAWKRLGSRFNSIVAGMLLDKPKGLYLSPFRGMRRNVVEAVIRYDGPFVYLDGLLLQSTSRITTIRAQHHQRSNGTSGYSFHKSVSLWLKMATSFSVAPLRLISVAGVLGSALGFVLAVVILVKKLLDPSMAIGWPSLIITVLMLGSMQLLALGAIGEYIGRVLLTINRKPQYLVRDTVNTQPPRATIPHDP